MFNNNILDKTIDTTVSIRTLVSDDCLKVAIIEHNNTLYSVEITADTCAVNPREDFHLWHWCTTRGAGYSDDDAMSLDELQELMKNRKTNKNYIFQALSLTRHSGDYIERGYYSDWDTGVMGYAYITKAELKTEYNVKKITKKIREEALKALDNEIETMNMYLNNEVYFIAIKNLNKNEVVDCIDNIYAKNTSALIDVVNYILKECNLPLVTDNDFIEPTSD